MACTTPVNFECEADLQELLAESGIIELPSRNHRVAYASREVDLGKYIPDIVIVSFKEEPDFNSYNYKWTYKHSFVSYCLKKHGAQKISKIAERCYSRKEVIEPVIKDMKKKKAVGERGESVYLKEKLRRLNPLVTGVEVKIKKWGRALRQATRYQEFADESMVVMPFEHIPDRSENVTEFKEKGVGLAGVTKAGLEWFVPKVTTPVKGPDKEHIVRSSLSHRPYWFRYDRKASCHART